METRPRAGDDQLSHVRLRSLPALIVNARTGASASPAIARVPPPARRLVGALAEVGLDAITSGDLDQNPEPVGEIATSQ
jgi:hypothetical protein